MSWKDLKPGGSIPARELNAVGEKVDALDLIRSTTLDVRRTPGGFSFESRARPPILARTVGEAGTTGDEEGCYEWEEVYVLPNGDVEVVVGGQSGTKTVLPARERNRNTAIVEGSLIELTLDPTGTHYDFLYTWGAASRTQTGVVTADGDTTPQEFSGNKLFWNTVYVPQIILCLPDAGGFSNPTGVVAAYIRPFPFLHHPGILLEFPVDTYAPGVLASERITLGPGQITMGNPSVSMELNVSGATAGLWLAETGGTASIRVQGQEGVTGTVAGIEFVAGVHVGGSFTGVTSVAGAGGSTGLTLTESGTGSVTLTLGGTLVPGSGGTGLTSTPPAGSVLTGTGSGYAQESASTFAYRWGFN